MGSNDEWAAKKGRELALAARAIENTGDFSYDLDQIAADITVALNVAAGKYSYALDAFEHGRNDIISRLNNPDEAMVEALAETAAASFRDGPRVNWKAAIRALAAELANEESNDK